MRLIEPSAEYKKQIQEYKNEFIRSGEKPHGSGGVLESTVDDGKSGDKVERYWIEL